MCIRDRYYTDDAHAEWVLAGVDTSEENVWFGTRNENHGLSQWKYTNGVYGLAATGDGMDMIGCYMRLIGEDGVIELGVDDGPALRYRTDDGKWKRIKTADSIHKPDYSLFRAGLRKVAQKAPVISDRVVDRPSFYERAIEEVVDALREGREPEISGRNALAGTELTFASWESARRRGRVDLPLDIEDNPLETLFGDREGKPETATTDD